MQSPGVLGLVFYTRLNVSNSTCGTSRVIGMTLERLCVMFLSLLHCKKLRLKEFKPVLAEGLIEAFLFKIFLSNFMTDNVKRCEFCMVMQCNLSSQNPISMNA